MFVNDELRKFHFYHGKYDRDIIMVTNIQWYDSYFYINILDIWTLQRGSSYGNTGIDEM